MTNKEYSVLYQQAQKQYPKITLKALREIKATYSNAVSEVTKKITEATVKKYAPVTVESLKGILNQLKKGVEAIENQIILNNMINSQLKASIPNWAEIQNVITKTSQEISEKVNMVVPGVVKNGAEIGQQINARYLSDVAQLSNMKLTKTGLENMFSALNNRLISNITGRVWLDGYSYSQRIWGIGNIFDDDIKRVLMTGLVENRDVLDIAKDLNVYANEGYKKLMKRYGDLVRGTTAFRRRIRKDIYYPSLRIVRSELYAGLHDNAIYSGKINPACTNMIKWIRHTTEDWNCRCPEYESNSPYRIEQVPAYAHSNCLCSLEPVLMDRKQFVEDMTAWGNGENVPYIENWYNQYYSQFAEVAA
ncbi:MAG: hypothetical protein ACM34M_04080 [Ignavibacteria bacterium]